MKRVSMIVTVALVMVVMALVVAVPAFAQAQVDPKSCSSDTFQEITFEYCNHVVSTPSGNRNNHSTFATETADGKIEHGSDHFHAKPARENGPDLSRGAGPVPKHCSRSTSEQGIIETFCDHVVTTPSGITNINSRYVAVLPDGEVLRDNYNDHIKPVR
ncbi:MAG: hypothetical protein M3317_08130 [Actinomycetota bacterium]|nr:hypothetical protein [Actinomycetota bacterium]